MPNDFLAVLGHRPKDRKTEKKKISPSHKRAIQQEREAAKLLGARQTLASGAKGEKGDIRKRKLLRLECKTTKNASFSITRKMLEAIEDAALASGEMPAILVEFNDGNGRKLHEVAVVPSYVLQDICEVGQ